MKQIPLLLSAYLLLSFFAIAQGTPSTTAAPGASLPGLGSLGLNLDGPGYVEIGGSHSDLTGGYQNWNDFYARGLISGGKNTFTGELTREARFGDSGWFGSLGMIRTLSPNWYVQFSAGGSVGGFFLPKYRLDAIVNRRLLPRRQLVVNAGGGFDQSKTVNNDWRAQVGAAYYFSYPVVLQGGFMWTHASPGNILARTQFIAASQGHDKERFVSLRYEWGREGYEVIGPPSALGPAFSVATDFPEHTITATWRQWVGPRWGLNFNLEQHQEPAYHRLGGTAGVFLDF